MRSLIFDDIRQIAYQKYAGEANRPYLIFLHEGLGCTALWRDFPERLCRRTGCPGLAYDRLGHGGSSPLQRRRTIHYLHEYALFELPRVIEAVLPEATPFILIGHSDGGSISLIAGAERSPLLQGIVTLSAHVFVEQISIDGIHKAEAAFSQGTLRNGLDRHHGEKTESLFQAWAQTWTSSWFRFWNIEYLLPSIEVPLLVLQGRNDPYGTSAQVEAIVDQAGGQAMPLFLEDCGHAPHLEFPDLTLDCMACFVNRVQTLG